MVTIVRTTNAVRLSFLQALLADLGIKAEVFDTNISALEAGIGGFPRRFAWRLNTASPQRLVLIDADDFLTIDCHLTIDAMKSTSPPGKTLPMSR